MESPGLHCWRDMQAQGIQHVWLVIEGQDKEEQPQRHLRCCAVPNVATQMEGGPGKGDAHNCGGKGSSRGDGARWLTGGPAEGGSNRTSRSSAGRWHTPTPPCRKTAVHPNKLISLLAARPRSDWQLSKRDTLGAMRHAVTAHSAAASKLKRRSREACLTAAGSSGGCCGETACGIADAARPRPAISCCTAACGGEGCSERTEGQRRAEGEARPGAQVCAA